MEGEGGGGGGGREGGGEEGGEGDKLLVGGDWQTTNVSITSSRDPPRKAERGSGQCSRATFLVTWGGAMGRKDCHNCIFESRTRVSDASAHIDHYTTKAPDDREAYWDSRNQLRDKLSLSPSLTSCRYN